MKKKAFLIGFLVLLLAAIPATVFLVQRQQEIRSRAAPASTIAFDPATKQARVNDAFNLNITLDTGVNRVATAEISLTFDPQKLTVTKLEPGSFMPHQLAEPVIDNTVGTAFIAIDTLSSGASSTDVPLTKQSQGSQPIAVVTLRAKAETGATPTQVGFSQATKAFGETAGTLEPTSLILTSTLGNVARITITAVSTTPTPTGGVTPSPTPTGAAGVNRLPVCNSLNLAPATGPAPLTVTLTANASDQDNDIVSTLFTFGDGQTQNVDKNIGLSGSFQVTHIYQNAGTLTPQAIVKDRDGGTSSACTANLTVSGIGGATPSATPKAGTSPTPVPTIPVTGDITPTTIFAVAGAALVILGAILFFAL